LLYLLRSPGVTNYPGNFLCAAYHALIFEQAIDIIGIKSGNCIN